METALLALGWVVCAVVTFVFIQPIARSWVMKALCLMISLLIGPFGILVVAGLRIIGALKSKPSPKRRRR